MRAYSGAQNPTNVPRTPSSSNSLWWAVASTRSSPGRAGQAARSDSSSKLPSTRTAANRFSEGRRPSIFAVSPASETSISTTSSTSDSNRVTRAKGTSRPSSAWDNAPAGGRPEALAVDQDHLAVEPVEGSQPKVSVEAKLGDSGAPVEHTLNQSVRRRDLEEGMPLELESLREQGIDDLA